MMLGILKWLIALAALVAMGWGAVKFCDLLTEGLYPEKRRQVRRFIRVGVGTIGVVLGLVIALAVGFAALFGTGCEGGLSAMRC